MAQTRTAEQIRSDIAAARQRLAEGVEGLVSQTHPAALKREAIGAAKGKARKTLDSLRGQVHDDAGLRWNRIGTAVLVLKGVIIVMLIAKGLGRLLRR